MIIDKQNYKYLYPTLIEPPPLKLCVKSCVKEQSYINSTKK